MTAQDTAKIQGSVWAEGMCFCLLHAHGDRGRVLDVTVQWPQTCLGSHRPSQETWAEGLGGQRSSRL